MNRYKPLRSQKPMNRMGTKPDLERADREAVRARAKGRCEVTVGPARCTRPDTETHHVIKRSQGGKLRGPDMLIRVCRVCHDLTDAAVTQATRLPSGIVIRGKLRIVAEGNGRFRCWFEAAEKGVSA